MIQLFVWNQNHDLCPQMNFNDLMEIEVTEYIIPIALCLIFTQRALETIQFIFMRRTLTLCKLNPRLHFS